MRVISIKRLRDFWQAGHADAERPLRDWYGQALAAQWTGLADVRGTYPHADAVRTRRGETLTVFNIGGNKYRLIVRLHYGWQLIDIRAILTHAEYDQGKWKE